MLPAVTPAKGTKKVAFTLMPLQKIDELFTSLKWAKYFTALDICSGYYFIKLEKESICKSAFTSVLGKIMFLRLPFDLSQGPDFFIWLIYDLFRIAKTSNQGQGSGYLAYLDDILIYSKTEKQHLQMLGKAFKCLLKMRIKFKLCICSFLRNRFIIGHLVSGTSPFPLANKIEALMKLKLPTNIKEVDIFSDLKVITANSYAIMQTSNIP